MQKIWLVAKRKEHRLPPALLFLYEPLPPIMKNILRTQELNATNLN